MEYMVIGKNVKNLTRESNCYTHFPTIKISEPHFTLIRPLDVQFDTHTACIVARLNSERLKGKQRRLRTIFSLHPSRVINMGENVLVRKRRTAFHKPSTVFSPDYKTVPTRIIAKNDKYLPFSYRLESDASGKWYYGHELRRVGPHYGDLESAPENTTSKIEVLDFTYENSPVLRSGTALPSRNTLFYRIRRGENIEKVEADSLRFFKKVLGPNSLQYNALFYQPENKHMII